MRLADDFSAVWIVMLMGVVDSGQADVPVTGTEVEPYFKRVAVEKKDELQSLML